MADTNDTAAERPETPAYIGLDMSATGDMTAWKCGKCNAVGTGWPPQPIFCDESEYPARRCASDVE